MPIPISRRVQAIRISATKMMPMIAAQVGGCVSLGQGVPAFAPPGHVLDAVCDALRSDPGASRYSLQPGMPELRAAVAEHLSGHKGVPTDPATETAITVGAMEALLMAVLTLADKDDEVILPAPCYPSHVEQVLLAQAKPVFAPCDPATWLLDPGVVEGLVTERTRAIVLCNPSNPTGAVQDEARIKALADIARRHDITVITDETYDSLVYDGPEPLSIASLPGMAERSVLVGSFSKTYALTGWRVGFCRAPRELMDQMLKVHDCTAICAPSPAQVAALAALTGPQDVVEEMRETLARRRDLACKRLDGMGRHFSYVRPAGAFYIMVRYLFTDVPSAALAERLIREAHVITIPGGAFGPGGEGHLRLSFGGARAELDECFDRLASFVAKH